MELTTGLVLALLITRSVISVKQGGSIGKMSFVVLITTSLLCLLALVLRKYHLVQLYPVLMNLGLAIVFGLSLIKSHTPIIETIARLHEKNLPRGGVKYTRNVTKAWLCFFILNGFVSLYTFLYLDLEHWTLYNGFISYILIGGLFSIEFFIRGRVKKKWEKTCET